jgi:hypothetical protein
MNKNEKKLADFVIGCFPDKTSINRIESHSTAVGFPDIEYFNRCARGVIELKSIPTISSKIPLRDTQIGWLYRRIDSGDKPLIVIKDEYTGDIYIVQFSYELQIGIRDRLSLKDVLNSGLNYHRINGSYINDSGIDKGKELLWKIIKELQRTRKRYERKG